MAGIAVAAAIFVIWGWITLWPMSSAATARTAQAQDFSPIVDELVVIVAAVGGLIGTSTLLVSGSRAADRTGALAMLDVVMTWAGLHLMYAVRYATLYYNEKPVGGIDFNGDEDPCFKDFFYFSYNLGMTYSVSDTSVTTTRMRAVVLRQSMLSYVFGAAIIANAINVVVGVLAR